MKIEVTEMGWDGVFRIDLARDNEQLAVCCVRGDESCVP
jgi:hypothetical protein